MEAWPTNWGTALICRTTDGKKYGTALMGSGNYTFGTSPTFLTPASCALLDACEVFSVTPAQQFYEGKPEVEVGDGTISF